VSQNWGRSLTESRRFFSRGGSFDPFEFILAGWEIDCTECTGVVHAIAIVDIKQFLLEVSWLETDQ
jgi:hypothetical protein